MTELTKDLNYLQSFIDEMNESSSGNYKIETIKKHSDDQFGMAIKKKIGELLLKIGVSQTVNNFFK